VTAFAEKLDGGVEQWNGLSADERLGFCVGVAPRKAKCVGGKARSRSRSGRQASAKKKKRSKKGWTCYTHFFVEKLRSDGIKLTRVTCEFCRIFHSVVRSAPDLQMFGPVRSKLERCNPWPHVANRYISSKPAIIIVTSFSL